METDNEPVDIPPPPHRTWPITVAGRLWMVTSTAIAICFTLPVLFISSISFFNWTKAFLCFLHIFGMLFIIIGKQTLSGQTKYIFMQGLFSICVSLMYSAVGSQLVYVTLYPRGVYLHIQDPIVMLIGILNIVCAVALLLAGILAITARADYQAWRETLLSQRNGN